MVRNRGGKVDSVYFTVRARARARAKRSKVELKVSGSIPDVATFLQLLSNSLE